jgi:hypothetical protein
MALTAKDVMERATIILQDTGAVRWPATELLKWLNDGQREIAIHKPTAVTNTVTLSLDAGTRQDLPATYVSLVSVHRNVDGNAIRPIDRSVLDNQIPGWQDTNVLPYAADVTHVIFNEANPREFYVAPGNTGTGEIEATVAVLPTDIAEPASPLDIASYTANLAVPEIWRGAMVDYVLYRAYSKDTQSPNAANRAAAHYQQFASAIGIKVATDQALNPDTTAGA